jgi:hypothetical protein
MSADDIDWGAQMGVSFLTFKLLLRLSKPFAFCLRPMILLAWT